MATAGTFQGHIMGIYIGATRIAATTGVQFSLGTAMVEIHNADTGDANVVQPSRRNASASGSGHFAFDAAYGAKDLIAAWKAGTKLTVLISTASSGDATYSFDGYIEKFDADFPDHAASTYTYSIVSTTDLTIGAVS